jgi:hypothetical protein
LKEPTKSNSSDVPLGDVFNSPPPNPSVSEDNLDLIPPPPPPPPTFNPFDLPPPPSE